MFKSHINLRKTSELLIEEEVEHMSTSEFYTSEASGRTTKGKAKKASKKDKRDTARGGRGLTGSTDQFCIYELANG